MELFQQQCSRRKVAPAIAAGCSVVAKLPAETPLTALALAELADRAQIPPGVINFVTTSTKNTPPVGKLLCESPIVKKISFTRKHTSRQTSHVPVFFNAKEALL